MDIKSFVAHYGRDELGKVALAANTTIEYLADQIGNGHRKPSPELALKLAAASDGRLTLPALRPDLWGKAATERAA